MFATLTVRVVPRAGHTALGGRRGGALVVRLAAAPVAGAANDALVGFLAGTLGVRRADISITAGQKSRDKRLRIAGIAPEELDRRIAAAGGQEPL